MRPSAAVLIPNSNAASELPCADGAGEPSRPWADEERFVVAGRWEAQSWTRSETAGLERRLEILREVGFVVIIIVGEEVEEEEEGVGGKGMEGR